MPAPAQRIDDELTLRRAQRGDERAWRDLIARFQPPVHALIWRMFAGRARDRVEDLVQETFVRMLKALPDFDPAGPATLSTWVLTIATRLTLNELRRPRAGQLVDEPAHEGEVARRQLAAAIAKAISALPTDQRIAIVLREFHGFEYAEIATALELDLNTVKSRLARARAALREALR